MPEQRKMTFNYLLTHKEIPKMYFETLDSFYQTILPSPDMTQRFLFFAYNRAKYKAAESSNVEPPFETDKFDMFMFGEDENRRALIITLPKCDQIPDTYQIAIPVLREKAGYYCCELSFDPSLNEPCFILGEWSAEMKHRNYGKIDMTSDTSFAEAVIELVYGEQK